MKRPLRVTGAVFFAILTFASEEVAFPGLGGVHENSNGTIRVENAAWTPPPRQLLRTPDTLRPRDAGTERLDHPDLLELLQRLDGTRHAFGYRSKTA